MLRILSGVSGRKQNQTTGVYCLKDPKLSIEYAKSVIGGRWPEAEPIILKDPQLWNKYKEFLAEKGIAI